MRFGDVFSKFSPQSEDYLRYLSPEFGSLPIPLKKTYMLLSTISHPIASAYSLYMSLQELRFLSAIFETKRSRWLALWLMLLEYLCRRGQPTVEFIFAATEEAVFVHVIVSAKSVKPFVIIYARNYVLMLLILIVKLTLLLMCEGMSGHFQVAMLRDC